jgi:modulator of FtsH protease HflK
MRKPTETGLEKTFRRMIAVSRWALPLLTIALLCTGIFRVNSDEVALILRMGKLVGHTAGEQILQPGLHFALPYVIDEVVKVPTGKIQEITVTTHTTQKVSVVSAVTENGYLLTGDNNIIMIEAAVKYRIDDPVAYALENADPKELIGSVVSGELLRQTSVMDVDSVLTTGKATLAEETKSAAQQYLDDADCGVTLTSLELTGIGPPDEVIADFEAVNTASVRKETLIQSANEYRESVIPAAQAQAQQNIDAAAGAQDTNTAQAYSDTAVFNGLLEQYRLSPETVTESYFRRQIAAVLARMQIYVIPEGENSPTVILP